MEIIDTKTGNVTTLTLIDPQTGVDTICDFIGTGCLNGTNITEEDGKYFADTDTIEWWCDVVNETQEMYNAVDRLSAKYGYDEINEIVKLGAWYDVDVVATATLTALKEKYPSDF